MAAVPSTRLSAACAQKLTEKKEVENQDNLAQTSYDFRRRVKVVEDPSASDASGIAPLLVSAEAAARSPRESGAEGRLTEAETLVNSLKEQLHGVQEIAPHLVTVWLEQEAAPVDPNLDPKEKRAGGMSSFRLTLGACY